MEEEPVLEDEQRCLARVLQGDLDAFGGLVRNYHTMMIHALTYRMTGSSAAVAEITQGAFVRAWQRLDQSYGESRFVVWLYRIARTLCFNWRERKRRRNRRDERWKLLSDLEPKENLP